MIYPRKLFGVEGEGGVDDEVEIWPVFNFSLLVSGVSNNLWNLEMADWFKQYPLVLVALLSSKLESGTVCLIEIVYSSTCLFKCTFGAVSNLLLFKEWFVIGFDVIIVGGTSSLSIESSSSPLSMMQSISFVSPGFARLSSSLISGFSALNLSLTIQIAVRKKNKAPIPTTKTLISNEYCIE